MRDTMTARENFELREVAERLHRDFAGIFNLATVERFIDESLRNLLPRAKTTRWVPLLAERHARDRLRALRRIEFGEHTSVPSILFLCVHNAGRSQMAAAWARHLGGDGVEVFCGGSEPAEAVNDATVLAMAERGIDISSELPQPWADEMVRAADVVVTMGCGDACPVLPGKRYVDWEVDDPAGRLLSEVRPIRDDLERRVRELLAQLGVVLEESVGA